MTLKEAVERHIRSEGDGFEIDDVVSGGKYPLEISAEIFRISQKYRTEHYKIGINNPDSFNELRDMAERYSE